MAEARTVEAPRIELLRNLAIYELYRRDVEAKEAADAGAGVVNIRTGAPPTPGHMPTHVPLWENEWRSRPEDIEVAVKEARALGQIDYHAPSYVGPMLMGPFLRITTDGMAWLRKIGEMPRGPTTRAASND